MLKIALDTNRYRDFCAGDREVLDRVQLAERVVLPFVTLAELRAGFRCGTRAAENERILQRFLRSREPSPVTPALSTCTCGSTIRARRAVQTHALVGRTALARWPTYIQADILMA